MHYVYWQSNKGLIFAASAVLAFFCLDLPPAAAQVKSLDCKAVEKIASVTFTPKLTVNVARDDRGKECHFFVALPPPHSISSAIDAWFRGPVLEAAKSGDPGRISEKIVLDLVSGIMGQTLPKSMEPVIKEAMRVLEDNSKSARSCVAALIDRKPWKEASADESFSCNVSPDFVVFEVRLAQRGFVDTLFLPRPA